MKIIDTKEYVGVLRELTEEGQQVSMLVSGNSMSPFLVHHRDYIYFEKPGRPLRKGDPVFFQRDDGNYVMHRICRVNGDGTYDIVGDNQKAIERGIREDQIFALVVMIKRNGKMIQPGDLWWEFFEKVWINLIPVRGMIYQCWKLLTPWRKKKSVKK